MGQKLEKEVAPTKVHTLTPADKTPRRFCPNRPGARAHPLSKNKKNSPAGNTKYPQTILSNRPGAQGLHPRVRSCAPAVKTKIPQTILPKLLGGLGAPVGFINSGSLMDLLPSKSLA